MSLKTFNCTPPVAIPANHSPRPPPPPATGQPASSLPRLPPSFLPFSHLAILRLRYSTSICRPSDLVFPLPDQGSPKPDLGSLGGIGWEASFPLDGSPMVHRGLLTGARVHRWLALCHAQHSLARVCCGWWLGLPHWESWPQVADPPHRVWPLSRLMASVEAHGL